MVKIKTEPINVSNTTLSSFKRNRHRKFDAKQAKRHDFGKAHCVVCDEVFTKNHHETKVCPSEECKIEMRRERGRRYREKNRDKVNAHQREYYAKNREKILAKAREYREENHEKLLEYERKYHEKNREKRAAYNRKYYAENREKIKARKRIYQREYRAKKKEE